MNRDVAQRRLMYVLVVGDDQHVLRLHAVRYLPRTNDGIEDPGSLRGPRNIDDWIGSDGGESDRGSPPLDSDCGPLPTDVLMHLKDDNSPTPGWVWRPRTIATAPIDVSRFDLTKNSC